MDDSDDLHRSTIRPGAGAAAAVDLRVPALTVAFHPDLSRVGDVVRLVNLARGPGHRCCLSRIEPAFAPVDGGSARPLGLPFLSRRPLELASSPRGGLELRPRLEATPLDVDGAPTTDPVILDRARLERGVVLTLAGRVVLVAHLLPPPGPALPKLNLVGEGAAIQRLRERIIAGARLSGPVLVRGETGVGKELVAHALADLDTRRTGPFVSVNLAALPPSTAAAELFGHAAGAFTGASRAREGLFVQAHGGTLFLDEVGEIPPEVQVMLLRVLESGEVQPLAGVARKVDVRVIAATDARLEDKLREGSFREALYHRLTARQIRVPSLAERLEDFGRLLVHFLRAELSAVGEIARLTALRDPEPWLTGASVAQLMLRRLPGNVRQLRNLVREVVLLAIERRFTRVDPGELDGSSVDTESTASVAEEASPTDRVCRPTVVDDATLLATLKSCDWQPALTARKLGISRTTLYALMERSGRIRKARDLSGDEISARLADCGGNVQEAAARLEVSVRGLVLRMSELGLHGRSGPRGEP